MSEVIQGSPEWHALRCGKVTASRVADIIRRTKSGFSTSRANYMAELIAERLTGEVVAIGFAPHPSIADSGASPDGLVGSGGLVEFKCPNTATHIDTLLTGKIDADYITQMQWQMACTGRQWCDWVSFDPRMPESMKLYVRRVDRDNDLIATLEKDVTAFLDEMAKKLAQLIALQQKQAA
jgi:hypothetical protein